MNVTITENDFREYISLKTDQERQAKEKQIRKEQRENFVLNQKIDRELMIGIEAGKTWTEYVRESAAPGDLKNRYLELQKESGIAPGSVKDPREDEFLRGFNCGS